MQMVIFPVHLVFFHLLISNKYLQVVVLVSQGRELLTQGVDVRTAGGMQEKDLLFVRRGCSCALCQTAVWIGRFCQQMVGHGHHGGQADARADKHIVHIRI